jgi:hypothetical protein
MSDHDVDCELHTWSGPEADCGCERRRLRAENARLRERDELRARVRKRFVKPGHCLLCGAKWGEGNLEFHADQCLVVL